MDDASLLELFATEQIAYYVAGPEKQDEIIALLDEEDPFDYGVVPLPSGPHGPAGPLLPAETMLPYAFTSDNQTRIANDLASFLVNQQQSIRFMRELDRVPANPAVSVDRRVYPIVSGFARQAQSAVVIPNEVPTNPLVAAGDVYYHTPARQPLQHVLTAIRHGVTIAEAGHLLFPNAGRHLKSLDEIREMFAAIPDAVDRTREIADGCTFSLDELRYEYPHELAPPGLTAIEYQKQLTWRGAARRYPDGVPDKVRGLLNHELQLIDELRYEAYFLTVWDLVQFARSRDILCQGRGSAANSAGCL